MNRCGCGRSSQSSDRVLCGEVRVPVERWRVALKNGLPSLVVRVGGASAQGQAKHCTVYELFPTDA